MPDSPSSLDAHADAWHEILDHAELLRAAAGDPGPNLVVKLRERYPRELVEVALELVAARRKAARKFPNAERLLVDVEGVEQATSARVAAAKAQRFAAAERVVDLCCGVGGDAMALAAAASVEVVDRSPTRVLMAAHNAGVTGHVADVVGFDPGAAWLHVDPARRARGRRLWQYDEYEPGPEVLEPMLERAPAAAVKLGPGLDWSLLPGTDERELEFFSDQGTLVQLVMWTGELSRRPGEHTATRLAADGSAIHLSGAPDDALFVAEAAGRYLHVPDPAIERARLMVAAVGDAPVEELAAGLGVMTSEAPFASPWFQSFVVHGELPWREPKIRSWLRDHDGGPVVVRTRDGAVPTDAMQIALRGDGGTPYVLFGLRLGKRKKCLITTPTP